MDNSSGNQQSDIMRYLDNEMNENEQQLFLEELKNNASLQTELNELQNAKSAVLLFGITNEVAAVRQGRKQNTVPAPVIKLNPFKTILKFAVAAACVVLVFLAINKYNNRPSADDLYASRFEAFEPVTVRDENIETSPIQNAYLAKKYNEVISLFKAKSTKDNGDYIMAGVAYMETNNVSNAIEIFKDLLDKNKAANTGNYNDEAKYYLALAYLKNKNYTDAVTLMQDIHNDKGSAYSNKFSDTYINDVKRLQSK